MTVVHSGEPTNHISIHRVPVKPQCWPSSLMLCQHLAMSWVGSIFRQAPSFPRVRNEPMITSNWGLGGGGGVGGVNIVTVKHQIVTVV